MNKLYCRMCGYETLQNIADYCNACGSTIVMIVPITFRPDVGGPEAADDGSVDRGSGGDG